MLVGPCECAAWRATLHPLCEPRTCTSEEVRRNEAGGDSWCAALCLRKASKVPRRATDQFASSALLVQLPGGAKLTAPDPVGRFDVHIGDRIGLLVLLG